jgi:hypothetical protein
MVCHQEYYNLLMMYSLCRRLFDTKDQERDHYKNIWKLQKVCPIIIIYNNLKCIPGKFLLEICPLKKPSKSLEPKELVNNLKLETSNKTQSYQMNIQQFYIKLVDWIVKLNSDVIK